MLNKIIPALASIAMIAAIVPAFAVEAQAAARPTVEILYNGNPMPARIDSYSPSASYGLKFTNPTSKTVDAKGAIGPTAGMIFGSCGVQVPARGTAVCEVPKVDGLWNPGTRSLTLTARNVGGASSLKFASARKVVTVPSVVKASFKDEISTKFTQDVIAGEPFTYTITATSDATSAPFKPILKSGRLGRWIDAVCTSGCPGGIMEPGSKSVWRITFVPTVKEVAQGFADVDLAIVARASDAGTSRTHRVNFSKIDSDRIKAYVKRKIDGATEKQIHYRAPRDADFIDLSTVDEGPESVPYTYLIPTDDITITSVSEDGTKVTGVAKAVIAGEGSVRLPWREEWYPGMDTLVMYYLRGTAEVSFYVDTYDGDPDDDHVESVWYFSGTATLNDDIRCISERPVCLTS